MLYRVLHTFGGAHDLDEIADGRGMPTEVFIQCGADLLAVIAEHPCRLLHAADTCLVRGTGIGEECPLLHIECLTERCNGLLVRTALGCVAVDDGH